jgi:hypothetical protein
MDLLIEFLLLRIETLTSDSLRRLSPGGAVTAGKIIDAFSLVREG